MYSASSDCGGYETVALFISTEFAGLGKLSDSGMTTVLKLSTFLDDDSNVSKTATPVNHGDSNGSKTVIPANQLAS